MRDFDVVGVFAVVAIYAAIFTVIGGVAYLVVGVSCSSKAEVMGVEYSYGIGQGCMVKYHGNWVPLDAVRTVAE